MPRTAPLAALLLLAAACRHPGPGGNPAADGREPLERLSARYDLLSSRGWTKESVFAYPEEGEAAIVAYRTEKTGPALWLVAGIHGEEPAGPNALARRVERVAALAESGVPVVLLPLCNPRGYRRGWRYPNTAERDWRKGGYSVGDSEHLLPDLEAGETPRTAKPAGPEAAALTAYALRLARDYPPRLVLDLHEDELSAEGGYIYSQGRRPAGNPVGARVVALLEASGIPIRLSGLTRFGEPIAGGVISQDDKGGPIRDGSIDELLAAPEVFAGGKRGPGPAAPTVIVVETPAFAGARLARRVAAHAAVLDALPELWALSLKP